MRKIGILALLAATLAVANTNPVQAFTVEEPAVSAVVPLAGLANYSEDFANINNLPGLGWAVQNNSNPPPLTPAGLQSQGWYQGNPFTVGFNAQAGATTSYIYTQFDDTGADFGGTISDWLITPEFDFSAGGTFTFATRAPLGDPAPEFLEVRQSSAGSSTNVGTTESSLGDFTTLLLTVGSLTSPTAYPGAGNLMTEWGLYSVNIAPLVGGTGSGRIGFRYFSPDGGTSGSVGVLIGIDSVGYSATAIPEPSVGSISALMLGFVGDSIRRRLLNKQRIQA